MTSFGNFDRNCNYNDMLFASYIKKQYVKVKVRLVLLSNIRSPLRFILRCCYTRYWYDTVNLDKPLRLSQQSQANVVYKVKQCDLPVYYR